MTPSDNAMKLAEKMEGLIREAYIKRRWTEPGWELLPSNVDLLLPYATALHAAEDALRYIAGEDVAGMDAHLREKDVARAALSTIKGLLT